MASFSEAIPDEDEDTYPSSGPSSYFSSDPSSTYTQVGLDPTRDTARGIINAYFINLVFTYVDYKTSMDGSSFAVYAARVIGTGELKKKYVLLFVPATSNNLPRQALISELDWANLQTRELSGAAAYKLQKQRWLLERLSDVRLSAVERTKERTKYADPGGLPIEVILLHQEDKVCNGPMCSLKFQYHRNMNLSGCLDTFSCSVRIL